MYRKKWNKKCLEKKTNGVELKKTPPSKPEDFIFCKTNKSYVMNVNITITSM